MTEFLHGLHGGIRYLVLLAGVIAVVAAALGWGRGNAVSWERAAMGAFVGLLDAQVLIGIALLLMWPFQPVLIGHITMMVLAAVVAHAGSVIARRRPPERQASGVRLAAIAIALVLIVGGILAIQRPII
ncbi:hypothetical protein BH23GEM10_BH23GEM10_08790 [soil metagenome]